MVDYGASQLFNGSARYDLFGFNPPTGGWLIQPVADKREATVAAAIKMMHGPSEDVSRVFIRSDGAHEIIAAIEQEGFAMPVAPYRPNSNRAKRAILSFSDLLRVQFLRSGFAPCFRPMLALATVQLWNLFRVVRRLDVDGNEVIQSPYQFRHGRDSVQADLKDCPMPGQLVTWVPPKETH